uniref:Uncharacterized protein n=1 Tax=Setaria italica TaxID=4555 RepID=K3ZNS1_SETIT
MKCQFQADKFIFFFQYILSIAMVNIFHMLHVLYQASSGEAFHQLASALKRIFHPIVVGCMPMLTVFDSCNLI